MVAWHDHVISGWDILNGTAVPSDEVLVVDGTGRHVALSAAEYCHRKGARVLSPQLTRALPLNKLILNVWSGANG